MRRSPLLIFLLLVIFWLSIRLPAGAQNFISLFSGSAQTATSDLHISLPSLQSDAVFHGVRWRTDSTGGTPYYGLRFGGYFRRQSHLGLELNYTHSKTILMNNYNALLTGTWDGKPVNDVEPISGKIGDFRMTHGTNIVALNVLYRTTGHDTPSFPHGRLQTYFGLGPAYFLLYTFDTVHNYVNSASLQNSGFGYDLLFGVRYGLLKKVYVYGEGKYTEGTAKVNTALGGTLETPLRAWHADLGIGYDF